MITTEVQNQNFTLLTSLFAVFLCILFGANAIFIKISLTGFGVFTMVFFRFTIAAIAMLLWAIFTKFSLKVNKKQLSQIFIFALIFTIQLSIFNLGISKTLASRGTLIVNLLPFFVLILAHFFIPGDIITPRKLIGISLGFLGIAFMFFEKRDITQHLHIGDMLVFFTAILWAINIIYIKKRINNLEPFHITFYSLLIAVPIFFLEALIFDKVKIINLNYPVVLSLLYQAIVTGSFGFIAWNVLLKKHGATALHTFVFIMPITGVLLSQIILNEIITLHMWIALFFIIIGLIIVHYKHKKNLKT